MNRMTDASKFAGMEDSTSHYSHQPNSTYIGSPTYASSDMKGAAYMMIVITFLVLCLWCFYSYKSCTSVRQVGIESSETKEKKERTLEECEQRVIRAFVMNGNETVNTSVTVEGDHVLLSFFDFSIASTNNVNRFPKLGS